jgi:hypothetical protein
MQFDMHTAVAVSVHGCLQVTKHKNAIPKNTVTPAPVSGRIRDFSSADNKQSDRLNIGSWEGNGEGRGK